MKKQCDNCSKELSKFSFFSSENKKIYRYNSAVLCWSCFNEVRSHHHHQLEKEHQQQP